VEAALAQLEAHRKAAHPEMATPVVEIQRDEEHDAWRAVVSTRSDGTLRRGVIDHLFLTSPEFGRLVELAATIKALGPAPYSVVTGGEKEKEGPVHELPVRSAREAVSVVLEEARKGQTIQRYKGLGEMNPEQLWETTMDPGRRTLLQVKVDDPVAADDLFTTLMGEHVEPRREFIERNALNVTNLDI
jgi:DNA gyrase subunit B